MSDKFTPWRSGDLRGANIWQGRWTGSSNPHPGRTIGNPISQADLDNLHSLGANYVQLSVAGLYSEQAPYAPDPEVQRVIDNIVNMASKAQLYVVVGFRSGPGRNEQSIVRSANFAVYGGIVESFWIDDVAQEAWLNMLIDAAVRYGANPAVIGIAPIVEPNSYARYGFVTPKDFYTLHSNALEDVNQFNKRATAAIRAVSDVPILLEGDGYGSVDYLPYLKITGDPRTVYTIHSYDPVIYTHQNPSGHLSYPGRMPINGKSITVDKAYLQQTLQPLRAYKEAHSVPVAVTEFGVRRYVPGAATYLSDFLDIVEEIGAAHAVWEFVVSAQRPLFNDFDVQGGPDASVKTSVDNQVQTAITDNFERNCSRASPMSAPERTRGYRPGPLWIWLALSLVAVVVIIATISLAANPRRSSRGRTP